ncbi:MAG: hypothetical protein Q4F29_02445 [Lachnospiraceae bacterium]|nr:hypothetical protein [Lachnospiraceae bacterium]
MLERKGFMPVNYLKKETYTGSYHGMRFKMAKTQTGEGDEEKTVLRVTHWPEPYGYDATKEELKTSMDTSFDEEGIQKGIDWLNQAYRERYQSL